MRILVGGAGKTIQKGHFQLENLPGISASSRISEYSPAGAAKIERRQAGRDGVQLRAAPAPRERRKRPAPGHWADDATELLHNAWMALMLHPGILLKRQGSSNVYMVAGVSTAGVLSTELHLHQSFELDGSDFNWFSVMPQLILERNGT